MDEDGYCYPSQRELVKTSRLAFNTVAAASIRLAKAGFLKRRKMRRRGTWPQYRYWARVPGDRGGRDPFDGGTTNVFGGG